MHTLMLLHLHLYGTMELPSEYPPIHLQRKYRADWQVVGRRVYVNWRREKKWYIGTVVRESTDSWRCHVEYADGDVSTVHEAMLPELAVADGGTFSHFELSDAAADVKYMQRARGEPRVFERTFVELRNDEGEELVAYVCRFLPGEDGNINRFEGLWAYKVPEVVNDRFVLTKVYGLPNNGAADPAVIVPGFNDRWSYNTAVLMPDACHSCPILTSCAAGGIEC